MADIDGQLTVPVGEIDYSYLRKDMATEALNRLLYQFKTSENICKLFRAFFTEIQLLQDTLVDLLDERQLAKATGAQLDVIGEIVGQDRSVTSLDFGFFGFTDDVTAQGFAELIDGEVVGGGRFIDIDEPSSGVRALADPEYLRFIIAKIFRNHFEWTTPDELAYIATIVLDSVERTRVYRSGIAEITYYFHCPGGGLSTDDISIISIVRDDSIAERQRVIGSPAGVGIGEYYYSATESVFSFDDDPDPAAAGFSEVSDSSIGGSFIDKLSI